MRDLGSRCAAAFAAVAMAFALMATSASGDADDIGTGSEPSARGYVIPVRGEVLRAFDPPAAPWQAGHRGVDLGSAAGAEVAAAGAGVVAFVGVVVDRPVVSVDHADGIRTTYEPVVAHVRRGDRVGAGQMIGTLVGEPPHCHGQACLHWGARIGADHYIDPMSLLGEPVIRLYPWGD